MFLFLFSELYKRLIVSNGLLFASDLINNEFLTFLIELADFIKLYLEFFKFETFKLMLQLQGYGFEIGARCLDIEVFKKCLICVEKTRQFSRV